MGKLKTNEFYILVFCHMYHFFSGVIPHGVLSFFHSHALIHPLRMTYLNKKGALQKDTLLKNALVHGGNYSNEVMLCQLIFYHFTISALYKMMYKIIILYQNGKSGANLVCPRPYFLYTLFFIFPTAIQQVLFHKAFFCQLTDKNIPSGIHPLPLRLLFLHGLPILPETGLCAYLLL